MATYSRGREVGSTNNQDSNTLGLIVLCLALGRALKQCYIIMALEAIKVSGMMQIGSCLRGQAPLAKMSHLSGSLRKSKR